MFPRRALIPRHRQVLGLSSAGIEGFYRHFRMTALGEGICEKLDWAASLWSAMMRMPARTVSSLPFQERNYRLANTS